MADETPISGPPTDADTLPNRTVDADHPEVIRFAAEHGGTGADVEVAVALYYAVRDGFRYNPWRVRFEREAYRASCLLTRTSEEGGHCIDKANLLAAAARARGIPSRLHFANVRNHVGTARLEAELGTNLLVFHGYTELWLEGGWVAATPAFNRSLCTHLGVAPLEFDGRADSIFQEWERGGYMEYVTDHGSYPEIPFERMTAEWRRYYPTLAGRGRWPEKPSS